MKRNLLQYLKKKIMYDEKSFEIENMGNKQNSRKWMKNADISQTGVVVHHHPNKINVFAAVSFTGKSKLWWFVSSSREKKVNIFSFFFSFFKRLCFHQDQSV